ncbi:hypothetical protein DPEC_G00181020 [Dallia pectoralis]|uniref:Uncharacterized protein n=1 Tax=Dallia pectoralis TaxID=75939 RepID=A0ACC2GAF2_DALPE|nr:hypothetical protein DPEC_G00181020 [Dallia pectoralis]
MPMAGSGGNGTQYGEVGPNKDSEDQRTGNRKRILVEHWMLALLLLVVIFISLYIYERNIERPMLDDSAGRASKEEKLLKRISILENASAEGWRYFNNSFYYVSDVPGVWEQSRQDCLKNGGDLVTMNSHDGVQDFLFKVMKSKKLAEVWIGLSNADQKHLVTRAHEDDVASSSLMKRCVILNRFDISPVKEVHGEQCEMDKYCVCKK